MGDDLDYNQFDCGDEILNKPEKVVSDDEVEIQDESIEISTDRDSNNNKEKKKLKLKLLKDKILNIRTGRATADLTDQFTASNQLRSLIQALEIDDSFPLNIKLENFFNPEDDSPKKTCPFFKAIRKGLPTFTSLLKEKTEESGCPRIIIICPGAIRATTIRNSLRKILKCRIAKLFAKHFKIQDQIDLLKQHHPVVIGTPCRIHKLIELGALSLSQTQLIILDLTKDKKNLDILTIPDVKRDVSDFILKDVNDEAGHIQITMVESISSSGK